MKKIALLLALLMLLCCAGCGEKEEAGQDATGAAGQQETTLAAEEAVDICPEADDGKHQYAETVVSDPTCTEIGVMMYTCAACDQSITEEIPAYGHQGTGASCEEPSVCTVCGEEAEAAWGHQDEGGVCKNCGTSMDEIEARPVPTIPEVTEPEETEAGETTEATEAETQQ